MLVEEAVRLEEIGLIEATDLSEEVSCRPPRSEGLRKGLRRTGTGGALLPSFKLSEEQAKSSEVGEGQAK